MPQMIHRLRPAVTGAKTSSVGTDEDTAHARASSPGLVCLAVLLLLPGAFVARLAWPETESPPVARLSGSTDHDLLLAAIADHDPERLRQHLARPGPASLVNAVDFRGFPLLCHAVQVPGPAGVEMVTLLLEHGAKVDQPGNRGNTPLMEAVFAGNTDVVRLLLDHGADPNARDHIGQSALHRFGNSEDACAAVTILLDAGADPGLTDHRGRTALDYARRRGNVSVAAILSAELPEGPLHPHPSASW